MKCNVCGTEQDAAKFCMCCGSPMEDEGDERTYLLDRGENPLFNLNDFEDDKDSARTEMEVKTPGAAPAPISSGTKSSVCTICGSRVLQGDRICATCGSPVSAAPVKIAPQQPSGRVLCTVCGSRIEPGDRVCATCGMPVAGGSVRNTSQINQRPIQRSVPSPVPAPAPTASSYESYFGDDDDERTQKIDQSPLVRSSASMFDVPPVPDLSSARSGNGYPGSVQTAPEQKKSFQPAGYGTDYFGGSSSNAGAGDGYPQNDYRQEPYENKPADNGYPQPSFGGQRSTPFGGNKGGGFVQPGFGFDNPNPVQPVVGSNINYEPDNAFKPPYPNEPSSRPAAKKKNKSTSSSRSYGSGALDEIYNLTGGVFMLIFAALFSVSLIYKFGINASSSLSLTVCVLQNILKIPICIALWMIFVNGKKQGTSTGGFTIAGVIMKIYLIFGILGYVLAILICILGNSFLQKLAEELTGESMDDITIVIVAVVAVIVVCMVLFILYWTKLGRMNKSIAQHIRNGEGRVFGAIYPLIFMIIGVIGKIITLIGKLTSSGMVSAMVTEGLEYLESSAGSIDPSMEAMVSDWLVPMVREVLGLSMKNIISDVLMIVVSILIIAAIFKVGPAKRESM